MYSQATSSVRNIFNRINRETYEKFENPNASPSVNGMDSSQNVQRESSPLVNTPDFAESGWEHVDNSSSQSPYQSTSDQQHAASRQTGFYGTLNGANNIESKIKYLDQSQFTEPGKKPFYTQLKEPTSVLTQALTVDDVLEMIGFGAYQKKIIALAGLAWMAESMTVNVLGVLAPEIYCRWRLTPNQEAALSMMGFLGLMVGCLFFGWVFDKFGRRFGMILSVTWSAVYALIACLSPRYSWLLINMFLMTVGSGASSLAAVFSTEFIPVKMRSNAICIMSFFWAGGACITAIVALATMGGEGEGAGWRVLVAFCAVPLFGFVGLSFFTLPETPRFSITSGNPAEAIISLNKIADVNGRHIPIGNLVPDSSLSEKKTSSIKDLFKTKLAARTTVSIAIIIFVVRFIYYGTILQTTEIFQEQDTGSFCDLSIVSGEMLCYGMCKRLHSNDYVDLLMTTLAEFPGLILTFFILERFGRRKSLCSVLIGVALIYSVLYTCPGRQLTDIVFFIARGLSISSFNAIVLYAAEVYPTSIRAFGLGFCSFFGGTGMMLAPIVTSVISKTSSHLATSIFVGLSTLGAIMAAQLPIETAGLRLGDIQIF